MRSLYEREMFTKVESTAYYRFVFFNFGACYKTNESGKIITSHLVVKREHSRLLYYILFRGTVTFKVATDKSDQAP